MEKIDKKDSQSGSTPPSSLDMFTLGQGFMLSQALLTVGRLGIGKLVADGPRTSQELAEATKTHEPTLYRFLRALAAVGVFEHLDGRRFGPTALSNHFDMLLVAPTDERSYQAWGHASHALQQGEPTWSQAHGKSIYGFLDESPEELATFSQWNTKTAEEWLAPLIDAYSFSEAKTLIDVGGGEGQFISAILKANSHLSGILFDQPGVVQGALPHLQAAGVVQRCEVIGGSFFETIPSGGDIYVVSRVLLNWDEDKSIEILNNIHRAMNGQGKLLVVDFLIPDPDHPSYQTLVFNDLNLLVVFGGANRTETEWRQLIERTPFSVSQVIPAPPPSLLSIIEATPQ